MPRFTTLVAKYSNIKKVIEKKHSNTGEKQRYNNII